MTSRLTLALILATVLAVVARSPVTVGPSSGELTAAESLYRKSDCQAANAWPWRRSASAGATG